MGFFDKLKKGLTKTRETLTGKIEKLVLGYADIDDDLLDELEETLIMADVGVKTTEKLMASVRKGIKKKEINTPEDLKPFLQKEITLKMMLIVQHVALLKQCLLKHTCSKVILPLPKRYFMILLK